MYTVHFITMQQFIIMDVVFDTPISIQNHHLQFKHIHQEENKEKRGSVDFYPGEILGYFVNT